MDKQYGCQKGSCNAGNETWLTEKNYNCQYNNMADRKKVITA